MSEELAYNRVGKKTMADSSKQEASERKGGLITMPFIIVNEAFERVSSYGLVPNMILYLMKGYHMDIATGTSLIGLWNALSNSLVILGAFISDSTIGRFRMVAVGSVISLLGTTLLWLTTMIPQAKPAACNLDGCENPTISQLSFLLLSLVFISIGSGCIKACSLAFGADQLVQNRNSSDEKTARVIQAYFSYYYASVGLSALIGLTVLVYIQDKFGMKVGFAVPAILMLSAASAFMMGSSLYVKMKPNKSLFTELAQVAMAAYKNRKLDFLPNNSNVIASTSDKLRFLNKACIGSSFCTVAQVEQLKALVRVIPIWSTSILMYTAISQHSITVVQAKTMNKHITSNFQIPAGSFILFMAMSFLIWVVSYDQVVIPLLVKYTGRSARTSPLRRMRIGLIITCLALMIAAIVENIRRKTAMKEGLTDDPKGTVSMSAMWLVPHMALFGLAEGLNTVGQIEYYYSLLPKSMSCIATTFYTLGIAVAGLVGSLLITAVDNVTKRGEKVSWLDTNLNKGHYDYYYALITVLNLLNLVYFHVICRSYACQENVRGCLSDERAGLKEELLGK